MYSDMQQMSDNNMIEAKELHYAFLSLASPLLKAFAVFPRFT
jgi:hypothetical protein